MRHSFTTVNDLRNWADAATTNWGGRTQADLDAIVEYVRTQDHCPAWGQDWTEYLESLPELESMI